MSEGGARWLPTRQPVVLDLWPVEAPDPSAPFTTVITWSNFGDRTYQGQVYGQRDRQVPPFFSLPRDTGEPMEIAVSPPPAIGTQLTEGGWRLVDPRAVTRDPGTYQRYVGGSRAEFCVARHAYVITRCGWFSDRSSAYLAMARPVILQDTGFSDVLPCGKGLLAFRTPSEARAAIRQLRDGYEAHCRVARAVVEEFFDSRRVLVDLLEQSL
jgi:hypothetical protein